MFGAGAYAIWGVFPLYLTLLSDAGALEVLAHRIAWSLVFVTIVLSFRPVPGRWRALSQRPRALLLLSFGSVLIAVNWGVFIWLALNHNVLEASLGYFVNPLVTVLLGVLILGEQLNRLQWTALSISALAVVVLTVDYGRPPIGAFALALSFGCYGLVKKKANVRAAEGLAVETAVLFPLALGYLIWLQLGGEALFGQAGWSNVLAFVGVGLATATPLLLFAGAATRVPLSVLGPLQYIGPILQFFIGVFLLSEPMPASRLAGFTLVWVALAIFSWDHVRRLRKLDRAGTDTEQQSSRPRDVRIEIEDGERTSQHPDQNGRTIR